jgi:hypothetical protein
MTELIAKCYNLKMIRFAFIFLSLLLFCANAHAQTPPQPSLQKAPAATPNPYANVPTSFLKEADAFRKYCAATPSLNDYYNCDCLSSKFLDTRIKQPKAGRDAIMLEIDKECPDATGAAVQLYGQCLGSAKILGQGKNPQEYCKCFANTYARLYEKGGVAPSSNSFVDMQTQAYITCSDPELGKRMYPYSQQGR